MKILLVSATSFEVKHLIGRCKPVKDVPDRLYRLDAGHLEVRLLITGIGILPTAFALGRMLAGEPFGLAVNAGICGAYGRDIPLGTVFHVTEEALPELGMEEEGTFRSLFEAGLILPDEFPFISGKLINPLEPGWEAVRRLERVRGNTIQTMRSSPSGIARLLEHAPARVESMEGAAFLYTCLAAQVPCIQIRSVSNYVGEQDKGRWEIGLAVKNLHAVLMELLEEVSRES